MVTVKSPPADADLEFSFMRWATGGPMLKEAKRTPSEAKIQALEAAKAEREAAEKAKLEAAQNTEAAGDKKEDGKTKDKDKPATPAKGEKQGNEPAGAANKDTKSDNATDHANTRVWTAADDAQILRMKDESKTWHDIAAAVHAPRKVVVARHKELLALKASAAADAPADDKPRHTSIDGASIISLLSDLLGAATDAAKPEPTADADPAQYKTAPDAEHASATSKKKKKAGSKPSSPAQAPASTPAPVPAPEDHTGNTNALPHPHLQPDSVWPAETCHALEMLAETYVDQKWLTLQSGLFNMTGQMIDAEFIRQKFEETGWVL